MTRHGVFGNALLGKRYTGHHLRGNPCHRHPGRFGHERHRPARAGIDFDNIDNGTGIGGLGTGFFASPEPRVPSLFPPHRELHVHQTDNFQLTGKRRSRIADLFHHRARQTVGGNRTRRVPRMNPRLFDVLHNARNNTIAAVANRIDVDLGGPFEETIKQHRLPLRDDESLGRKLFELLLVVTNLHRAATEHKTRTYQKRITNLCRHATGLIHRASDAIRWLLEVQAFQQLLKFFAILSRFDRIDARANDWHAGTLERAGQIERCLPAELHDHAIGLDAVANVEHVFHGERLEEQQIARVVIGADRLRIRVDHHRFDAEFAHRETRVTTTVIELDPLSDTIRPTAENHDPLLARLFGGRFVFGFVSGIVVRRVGFKLRRAGVDRFERRDDTECCTTFTHLDLCAVQHDCELPI